MKIYIFWFNFNFFFFDTSLNMYTPTSPLALIKVSPEPIYHLPFIFMGHIMTLTY